MAVVVHIESGRGVLDCGVESRQASEEKGNGRVAPSMAPVITAVRAGSPAPITAHALDSVQITLVMKGTER